MSRRELFNSTETSYKAFGFEIPVTFDGRRIWPPRLKTFILEKLQNGQLTVTDICRECDISPVQVARWREQAKPTSADVSHIGEPVFVELKLIDVLSDELTTKEAGLGGEIVLCASGCEPKFPLNYPVDRLAALVHILGSDE